MRVYKRQQRRGDDPVFELPLGKQSLAALDSYFQARRGVVGGGGCMPLLAAKGSLSPFTCCNW